MTYSRMLDTNTVSKAGRGAHPLVDRRLARYSPGELCISAITEGEILYGIAKNPDAVRIARMMHEMLAKVAVLPWTRETAALYGRLRAQMRHLGLALTPLDMLIAAHALESGAILVTSDRAFRNVPGLRVEDWTAA